MDYFQPVRRTADLYGSECDVYLEVAREVSGSAVRYSVETEIQVLQVLVECECNADSTGPVTSESIHG